MKTGRMLVLLVLVIGLLAGPWQAPAEAEMLGRPSQFKNLFYGNSDGKWYQTNPDGTLSIFSLAAGQSYVMTQISVRFYVTDPATQTGPYRFYLIGPNASKLYVSTANDIKYPGSDTVWGGGFPDETIVPGIVLYALPTPEMRQLLQPPANPNSGPVRTGTFYIELRGYVVP